MPLRCPLIVALLSGGLLLVAAGAAVAQESEVDEFAVELWLQRCESQMTRSLSERIERDTSRTLVPIVELRLLAVVALDSESAGPPPASLAFAIDFDGRRPVSPPTSMRCAAFGGSFLACVVSPAY